MGDRIKTENCDNLSNFRNEGLPKETADQMFSKDSPVWNSKQNVENSMALVQQGICPALSLEDFSVKALTEGARNAVNIVMEAVNHRTEGFEPDKEGQSYVLPKCDPEPPVNEHVNPDPPDEGLPEERVPFIHPPNHPPNSHKNPDTDHRHEGHNPGVEEDERNEFRPTRTQVDP